MIPPSSCMPVQAPFSACGGRIHIELCLPQLALQVLAGSPRVPAISDLHEHPFLRPGLGKY